MRARNIIFYHWVISTILFIPRAELYSQEIEHSIIVASNYNTWDVSSKSQQSFIEEINNVTSSGTIVFLGDYLPKEILTKNKNSTVIKESLEHLRKLPNKKSIGYAFLPGFTEWGRNKINGPQLIRNTNDDINDIITKSPLVLSENACPGPYQIDVNDDLLLILFNDYWLLNDNEVPKIEAGCVYTRKIELLLELEDILKNNIERKVILFAINPLESSGEVGSKFKTKHHIFPFSVKKPKNRIPLPLFGSIYLGYRKIFGNPEDLSNLKSRILAKYLKNLLAAYPKVVYVSSNEAHLDLRHVNGTQQIIAGSLNGGVYSKSKNPDFNSIQSGFTKLNYYSNGLLELQFIHESKVLFSKTLLDQTPFIKANKNQATIDYSDSTANFYADSSIFKANKTKPGLMGINYRYEWGQEVKNIPYFNWGKDLGGLEIVQKGGGQQTRSLRLETKSEKQYVLRSIKKYPESAVPAEIRGTIFAELVNDQISSSHPYGAFAVPKLAEAAEIYHTNPKLVYLKKDPRLGEYSNDFEEGFYLYEERPAKNRDDISSFGFSKDIENTFDVINKTKKSGKYYVDQQWVLKSRIFDLLIGDWDRHDDQWRWAKFETGDKRNIYRPIPRDRDQAFFFSDGLILKIASRKWGMPKFQGFEEEIRDVPGLGFNARYFDRSFLSEPNREDWIIAAKKIQSQISDSIIQESLKELPDEIYALNGHKIENKLKSRRQDLPKYAESLYEFLAKSVSVLGNDEENLFEVERKENGNTLVKVYEVKKKSRDKKYKLYEREFIYGETKEIRLYGFKADDEFKISGKAKKGIKVRIIAGGGEDKVIDESRVKGVCKKTLVYDKKQGMDLSKGPELRDLTSNKDEVNDYDRYSFKYNKLLPFVFVNYNPDDGVYIGGGPIYTNHSFRKDPFNQRHSLLANVAPKSANYNLSYKGIFTDIMGKWDLFVDSRVSTPSFSTFYYGSGNNTIQSEKKLDEDNQYYRVRFNMESVNLSLGNNTKNEKHQLKGGLGYLRAHISDDLNRDNDDDDPRFILDIVSDTGQSFSILREFTYAKFNLEYSFDSRNDKKITERGMYFNLRGEYFQDIKTDKFNALRLSAEESIFTTISKRFKTILALRAGAEATIGDTPFFLGPSLGGGTNLRGFRRNRFWGDYSAYQNSELRFRLFKIQNEFLLGDFGFLLFHDIGRVWTNNATDLSLLDYTQTELQQYSLKQSWHQGYGFGLWFAPFDMTVISADYSFNELDNNVIFVRFGFLF